MFAASLDDHEITEDYRKVFIRMSVNVNCIQWEDIYLRWVENTPNSVHKTIASSWQGSQQTPYLFIDQSISQSVCCFNLLDSTSLLCTTSYQSGSQTFSLCLTCTHTDKLRNISEAEGKKIAPQQKCQGVLRKKYAAEHKNYWWKVTIFFLRFLL